MLTWLESEPVRGLLLVSLALIAGTGWMALRALRLPAIAPDRLVAELRLAQFAALVLALTAGSSLGLVAAADLQSAALPVGQVSTEVMFALGWMAIAAIATIRDPREALTLLAIAFGAHALFDVSHRPDLLGDHLSPGWFTVGSAVHDLCLGVLCYLPVLRR